MYGGQYGPASSFLGPTHSPLPFPDAGPLKALLAPLVGCSSWAVTRYETGHVLFAIIGGLIGGEIVPGKGSNKRTKRTEALGSLVGAMLPAVLFGGLLWGIGGSAAIAFAALGLIFAGLVAIYLYV